MQSCLKSDIALCDVAPNIGTILLQNAERYGRLDAFSQREGGSFVSWTWRELVDDVCRVAYQLQGLGIVPGTHIGIISRNSYHRLVAELAVMAGGCVSVPIFHRYAPEMIAQLLEYSDVQALITDAAQLFDHVQVRQKHVILLHAIGGEGARVQGARSVGCIDDMIRTTTLMPVQRAAVETAFRSVDPAGTCIIMFTSGTTRFPKGVMLSHRNLMSQQRALAMLWNPEPGLRFLSYLPWHHSYGGLFERFFALHSGGCLAVDDSQGKDVDLLLRNFSIIRPHIYFSVPKVLKEIRVRMMTSPESRGSFFHDELKFVFTAAASLDRSISDIFTNNGVPVVEGWGLTETSPCCTLTDPRSERVPGNVGVPIPGVEVAVGDDEEILVRGVNVMKGYYKLDDATAAVLDEDGWFRSGDLGSISDAGLRILDRKDRVFKLSNGEKVFPGAIEQSIGNACIHVKHVFVSGAGEDRPYALLFMNRELLSFGETRMNTRDGCLHPNSMHALKDCITECLHSINRARSAGYERIGKAVLINEELRVERDELTPTFKIIPRNLEKIYHDIIECMRTGDHDSLPSNACLIDMSDCRRDAVSLGGEEDPFTIPCCRSHASDSNDESSSK